MAPLQSRREDIPLLTGHFLGLISRRTNRPMPRLNQANLLHLQSYNWLGNVGELQNVFEHAVTTSRDVVFQFDLPQELRAESTIPGAEFTTVAVSAGEVIPKTENSSTTAFAIVR